MRTLIALAAMLLPACVPAITIQEREVDGIPFVLVLDANESMCGRLKYNEGCTVTRPGVKPHVYMSSIAPRWVYDHEIEHVRGMKHSEWKQTPLGFCCFVIYAGGSKKYERGDTLCNDGGTERIIRL